jgi:folate-binding protein YgfZ
MSDQNIILDHRSVVSVTGKETIAFLDRILTCRLSDLESGTGRFGALLTAQGKILTDLFVYRTEDGLFLDLPENRSADTIKRLTLLKLRADVKFELRDKLRVVSGVTSTPISAGTLTDMRYPTPLTRYIISVSDLTDEHLSSADERYDTERIAAGLAECGRDYQENDVFPADVNMDLSDGIDFKKGCFVGQEVASRMKRKTEVRKRTLVLSANAENITPGTPVIAGESALGEVSSWSGTTGLARIRLDRLKNALERGLSPEVSGNPVICELISARSGREKT